MARLELVCVPETLVCMDEFCHVNDFATSLLNQNFTNAWTYSRGSSSMDKIGLQRGKFGQAQIKCVV